MKRFLTFFFCLLLLAAPLRAEPEAAVDLSQDFFPVTEDFDGANMTVFGALRSRSSHIAIVLEGPPVSAMVRPKVRKGGIWVNDEALRVEKAPSFYAVLSSEPVQKIASRSVIKKHGLTIDSLSLDGVAGEGFRQNRMSKGLYYEDSDSVKIRAQKLFRADIRLPPNVPVGEYKAAVYEISGAGILASRETTFRIEQTGVNGHLKALSYRSPVLYALLCLVVAFGVGGATTYYFNKRS